MSSQSSSQLPLSSLPALLPLHGFVQHYAWGGHSFIPELIGRDNPDNKEFAELWMGTHPKGQSQVTLNGDRMDLIAFIAAHPEYCLGAETAAQFNNDLPYLFKVLDAHKMLSIQVHPDKKRAERGFAREETAGIDRSAANRNYRDKNHKPELHVALTEFWMLHGFRALSEIATELRRVPEFLNLTYEFEDDLGAAGDSTSAKTLALKALYHRIMTLPQGQVDAFLEPLIQRLMPLYAAGLIPKNSPDFWAARAAEHFPLPGGRRDRGIFSIYLMNLVHLQPGQATFQGAGIPHAYLEGANVELMACSDNVLRGGLTPKHIDVPELLETLTYSHGPAEILYGTPQGGERVFSTPVQDFELTLIELDAGECCPRTAQHGPDILFAIEGQMQIKAGESMLELGRGAACFLPHAVAYQLEGTTASRVFRASVPAKHLNLHEPSMF